MLVVGESAGRHINDYSSQFQHDFVQLLSRRYVPEFSHRLYRYLDAEELTTTPLFAVAALSV